jgi:TRAP-type transport system small permease protein
MQKANMHKTIDRLLYWSTGVMAAMALFSIMWLTVVDVVGRKFFDNSVPGGLELTEMLMVVVIFGAAAGLVARRACGVRHAGRFHSGLAAQNPGARDPPGVRRRFFFLGRLMVMRAERFAEYGDTTVYLGSPSRRSPG